MLADYELFLFTLNEAGNEAATKRQCVQQAATRT
jgi:hypothetical protein